MSRKRSIRASLLLLVTFGAGCFYGYMVHRSHWPPYQLGRDVLTSWRAEALQDDADELNNFWVSPPGTDDGLSDEQQEAIDRLRSIGYVTTVDESAGELSGGVVWNSSLAQPGLTLYTAADGPAARLIDLEGSVVHEWAARFADVFPQPEASDFAERDAADYWFRAAVQPNGDLLVIHEGIGLARLDVDSNVLWSHLNSAHHDVVVGLDGRTYALTRKAHVRPDVHAERPILEDFVTILGDDGAVIDEISLLDAVLASEFTSLIELGRSLVAGGEGDVFHTNDVDLHNGLPWDPRSPNPDGSPSHLLVSFRNLDAIVALDLNKRVAVWANLGLVHRQHDPTLFSDGRLLVFDNRNRALGSRAVEYSTDGLNLSWVYPGPDDPSRFSDCCGMAQRLPNGNTLITFSLEAVALEVTPEGEVAWEFQSPIEHESGRVAALMQVERLPGSPAGYLFLAPDHE